MNTNGTRSILKELFNLHKKSLNMDLPIASGTDTNGTIYFKDLTSLHHLLIAGNPGQGKTSCINGIITSLERNEVCWNNELILISRNMGLFSQNNPLNIIHDLWEIMYTLEKLNKELEIRFKLFKEAGVKDMCEYNALHKDWVLSYIVVVIDEFGDLANSHEYGHKIHGLIITLAQVGHKAGIHLVISTNHLSYSIISNCIKANFPARMAFKVTSESESLLILDRKGAEALEGNGKLIFNYGNEYTYLDGIHFKTTR